MAKHQYTAAKVRQTKIAKPQNLRDKVLDVLPRAHTASGQDAGVFT